MIVSSGETIVVDMVTTSSSPSTSSTSIDKLVMNKNLSPVIEQPPQQQPSPPIEIIIPSSTSSSSVDIVDGSIGESGGSSSSSSFLKLGVHRHRHVTQVAGGASTPGGYSSRMSMVSTITNSSKRVSSCCSSNVGTDDTSIVDNQPSFNELTITCDTLTETDDDEQLFCTDEDDDTVHQLQHNSNDSEYDEQDDEQQDDDDDDEEEEGELGKTKTLISNITNLSQINPLNIPTLIINTKPIQDDESEEFESSTEEETETEILDSEEEEDFQNFKSRFLYDMSHNTTSSEQEVDLQNRQLLELQQHQEQRRKERERLIRIEENDKRQELMYQEFQAHMQKQRQEKEEKEKIKQQEQLVNLNHLHQLQQLHHQHANPTKHKRSSKLSSTSLSPFVALIPSTSSSTSSSFIGKAVKSTPPALTTPSLASVPPKIRTPSVPTKFISPKLDIPPNHSSTTQRDGSTSPDKNVVIGSLDSLSSLSSFTTNNTPSSIRSSPYLSSPMMSPRFDSLASSTSSLNEPIDQLSFSLSNSSNSKNNNNLITPILLNNCTDDEIDLNPSSNNIHHHQIINNIKSISSSSLLSKERTSSSSSSSSSKGIFHKFKKSSKRLTQSILSNHDESTTTFVQVYRGNDESWNVKVNASTTVRDLFSMVRGTSNTTDHEYELYISKPIEQTPNCLSDSGSYLFSSPLPSPTQSSNILSSLPSPSQSSSLSSSLHGSSLSKSLLSSSSSSAFKDPFISTQSKRQLNEDEKLLHAQKKWTGSSVFILKTINSKSRYSICSESSDYGGGLYFTTSSSLQQDIPPSPVLSSSFSSPNSPDGVVTYLLTLLDDYQLNQGLDGEKPKGEVEWINPNEIQMEKQVGAGSFAKVYRGKYKGETVAIKVLKDNSPEQFENFKKEFDSLSMVSSEYLIRFHGASKEKKLKMVMEYCHFGSLNNIIRKKRFKIDWFYVFKWMIQSFIGLNVLHNMKLVHRDIKSHNLLINIKYDLKVADLGLTKPADIQTNSNLKGTMAYCAPELYSGAQYSSSCDVYSMGIVMWELITRCLTGKYLAPFGDYPDILVDFQILILTSKQGIRPTMPNNVPLNLEKLVRWCWNADPLERPTCVQVLENIRDLVHEYANNRDEWDQLIRNYQNQSISQDSIIDNSVDPKQIY